MSTSLTERRKQFLGRLLDLYCRTNLPVHYEAVAQALGVSKWTAYDMLTALEKLGYLTHDYAITPGEPGRSQIVFLPTPAAQALFAQSRASLAASEDWERIKAEVLGLLDELKAFTPSEAIQRILQEIPKSKLGVAFCTYVLGLLLVYLRTLGETAGKLVSRLVQNAPGTEMRLTMFVGTVAGTVIQTVSSGLSGELADLTGRFLRYVKDLAPLEQEMLVQFLNEALAQIA